MWRNKRLIVGAVAGVLLCTVSATGSTRDDIELWEYDMIDVVHANGFPSSVLLPNGEPALSYADPDHDKILYAWREGDSWSDMTVATGPTDPRSSLALLPSGDPAVCYLDENGLEYAWFDGEDWHASTVTSDEIVDFSLAILPSGHPAIAYISSSGLYYVYFDGADWQTTSVDEGGTESTSLAILSTGQPAIAYLGAYGTVEYAVEENGSFTSITADDSGDAGRDAVDLTILPGDKPAISYVYTRADEGVRCASMGDSGWELQPIYETGGALHTSISTQPSGEPAISFGAYGLWFARRHDGATWEIDELSSMWTMKNTSSVFRDSGGAVIISANSDDSGAIHCHEMRIVCELTEEVSHWRVTTADEGPASYLELAVLPNGQPAMAYVTGDGVEYAWLEDEAWYTTIVAAEAGVGYEGSSLAIQPSGQPAISYHAVDSPVWQLRYAAYDGISWNSAVARQSDIYGHGRTSLAFPYGQPAVSYGWCDDPAYAWFDGDTWHSTTLEWIGGSGYQSCLRVLPSGNPARVFMQSHMAVGGPVYNDSACTGYDYPSTEDLMFPGGLSLAIFPSGDPAVTCTGTPYSDGSYSVLRYCWREGCIWKNAILQAIPIDPGYPLAWSVSLAVLPSGQPSLSYRSGSEGKLWFVWLEGDGWHTTLVDEGGEDFGAYCSLAILPYGEPAIVYKDPENELVKYAVRLRLGDLNCDGVIDFFDIDGFVLAVTDPAGYDEAYPGCERFHADCNGDGAVDFFDIDTFVALIIGAGSGK